MSLENTIKLVGFICAISAQYFMIKSDIRELSTEKKYEIEHLQYQVTELKDCCNNKSKERKISLNYHEAILPSGIDEND